MDSCFLLIGKERLLKKEFILDLRKKYFQDSSNESLNFSEWDASEGFSLDTALSFMRTAPFLADKRIAVIREIETLEEEDQKKLIAYLETSSPTAVLVLASEETGTKKKKFLQELQALSTLVACHPPFE